MVFRGLAGALCAAALTCAAADVAAAAPAVRIKYAVSARSHPSYDARKVARIRNYTPLSLSKQVLPLAQSAEVSSAGTKWVKVKLPVRPNGATGWIPARATKRIEIPWRVEVSLGRRLARVYRDGRVVKRFRVVVGARSTPTPRGRFFVVEHVRLHNSWAHGLWALALSAHSNVLKRFDGGDGQVALHARGSLSAPLGSAASHGCVRFANGDVAWMARNVPNGTPVEIR
jgi:lipoprotein-anchoring transpeptidase ErfK/SrfK